MSPSDRASDLRVEVHAELAEVAREDTGAAAPPPPANATELAEVLVALREVAEPDRRATLRAKLRIAGLVDHPNGGESQRCMECMYFVVHRKWCELPELALPVEPEWWCRLWRA